MVKELKHKGKVYPVKISYYALSRLQSETGKTPDDIGNDMQILEPLFYYSVEAGCKELEKEFTLNREEVPFILDDIYLDFLGSFGEFFSSSGDTKKKKA